MTSTCDGMATMSPEPTSAFIQSKSALLEVLHRLDEESYDFIAPTPASHARVLVRRPDTPGQSVIDLLGWSKPCREGAIGPLVGLLEKAHVLDWLPDGTVRSRIRVSRVMGNLFIHSRFPTTDRDAVFLGPDSHRFADFILRKMSGRATPAHILDYGAGAGVGGIIAATHLGGAMLTLADINPDALALASINAEHAGLHYEALKAHTPLDLDGRFDLIVMHPPFMIDAERRAYRDGGDLHGGRMSVEWPLAGMTRLAADGRLLMHTGVSIVDGKDMVREKLNSLAPKNVSLDYRVLDPDIFGDELDKPAYADVDRIAAIGLEASLVSLHP